MGQTPASTPKDGSSGRRTLSRVISAVIFSLTFGLIVYFQELSQSAMGKAAFLAADSARYDKYLAHPQFIVIITGFIAGCIIFGAYELLAFGIYKVIAPPPRA